MEIFAWLVAMVFAIIAFRIARRSEEKTESLERDIQHLRRVIENLARSLADLRRDQKPEAAKPPEPKPVPKAEPPPVPKPAPAPAVAPAVASEPQSRKPEVTPDVPPPIPPSAPPPKTPEPPPPPAKPLLNFDWENLVGVRLFSWIGGIALVLAAVFFLREAATRGWLQPPVRAAIGLITGAALVFICELRIARGYKFTANAMHGAAIAVLYATLFAVYARWHLAPGALVFALMIGVTAIATWLSIRRESVFIALLGLLGGFSTPALLSTGENRPIGLFTYLLLLNIGLAWVALRRRWIVLSAVCLAFTALYQWAWIAKFLTVSQLPLAATIFVVFALAAASSLWIGRKTDGNQQTFDQVAIAGAALPLLFAAFAAAVPGYGARYNVLFGFLFLVAAGLAVIAALRGPRWIHLLGGVTTLLVFAIWRAVSFTPRAWPGVLGWVVAFVLLYLGAATFNVLRGEDDKSVFIAPVLLFVFPTFIGASSFNGAPGLVFFVLFALLACISAFAVIFEEGLVYYVAAFVAVATEAVWSARFLSEAHLLSALALYGVFALFFLGVPLVAQKFGRRLEPRQAFSILVLVSIAMLLFLDSGAVANAALWGLAILLGILNAGAMLQARTTTHPLLSILAAVVSWIVIAFWWSSATITGMLLPALLVVGAFGVLIIAGNLWALGAAPPGSVNAQTFERSHYLALIGHFFLLFVASQRNLAIPPWPLFGVLLLLQLAIGVAAIWLRRERLMTAGVTASQFVLMIWAMNSGVAPWPNVALIAALAIMALAMTWYRLDRRFAESVILAAFAGQFVGIVAAAQSKPPLFATLLIAQALLLLALFIVAWIEERHFIITIAAVTAAIATPSFAIVGAGRSVFFAAVIYAMFLAYPLLLGKRAKQSLHPYLAPVIASAAFFGFAYDAMKHTWLKDFVGALPVLQSLLLLVLLWRLLQIERDVERLLSRLALVAGAALAFITVAIPLQLDKQWITIGWALEGAALIWLYRRIPHRGLLMWGGGLLAVVFARLTLNPAVLSYHPRAHVAILNWYLYTYLVAAVATFAGGYFMPAIYKRVVAALHSAATILLFFLLNIEIADYFSTGATLTFNFFSSSLKQDLMYTLFWALFALAMLIAGIVLHAKGARVAALLLLVVTILKCFLHDLARLGGLYRVGSLLGLAASLVLVGLLLQRFVMRDKTVATP